MSGAPLDWEAIGYQEFYAAQHSKGSTRITRVYPTQDRYSVQDEADYVRGYNRASAEYASRADRFHARDIAT